MAVEHRAYEVIRQDGSIELRRYPAYITATVKVVAEGYNEATYAGFNALAGYIFGNNSASGSIPMTTPVTSSRSGEHIPMMAPVTASRTGERIPMTAPVSSERVRNDELDSAAPICTIACEGEYAVRFTMPSHYTSVDELPAPNDRRVVLEAVPEYLAVAARFGGRLTEEAVAEHVQRLKQWIAAEDLEIIGEPEAAQYDAPWKPGFARHNDVIIPVSASRG